MNISLRKSSALQNSIQEVLRSIKVDSTVTVNEFVVPETAILAANTQFVNNDIRRVDLLVAYYNIRSLVATANVSCGISMKLANAAFIDRRIVQIQEIIDAGVRDIGLVERRIEKIRLTDNNSRLYGRESDVVTSVLTADQVATFKSELQSLKKQKQQLNDEILELNIKTEITLSAETLQVLQAEGLI